MPNTITPEPPNSPAATQLITELEAHLSQHYPAHSRHGFSSEKLLRAGVAFFIIRKDEVPAGCGGVQLFPPEYAELKRMYIRPAFRGQGLAKQLLDHLAAHARQHAIPLLRL